MFFINSIIIGTAMAIQEQKPVEGEKCANEDSILCQKTSLI